MTGVGGTGEEAMATNESYFWDAALYDQRHGYVTRYGGDVVELLNPQPGERILDLGCGTGHLTQKIAEAGATAIGLDHSHEMIEEARAFYPHLEFLRANAADFHFPEPFDAVFSNAALHWIKEAEAVIECISRSLKPEGRLVAEFGGKGNIRNVIKGIQRVWGEAGVPIGPDQIPWRFPGIPEYGALLEKHGLELVYAALFDRPTALEGGEDGLESWMKMFGQHFLELFAEPDRPKRLEELARALRPTLFREGAWFIDYRRLRLIALKTSSSHSATVRSSIPNTTTPSGSEQP